MSHLSTLGAAGQGRGPEGKAWQKSVRSMDQRRVLLPLDAQGGSIIQVISLQPLEGEGQSVAAGQSAGLAAGGLQGPGSCHH